MAHRRRGEGRGSPVVNFSRRPPRVVRRAVVRPVVSVARRGMPEYCDRPAHGSAMSAGGPSLQTVRLFSLVFAFVRAAAKAGRRGGSVGVAVGVLIPGHAGPRDCCWEARSSSSRGVPSCGCRLHTARRRGRGWWAHRHARGRCGRSGAPQYGVLHRGSRAWMKLRCPAGKSRARDSAATSSPLPGAVWRRRSNTSKLCPFFAACPEICPARPVVRRFRAQPARTIPQPGSRVGSLSPWNRVQSVVISFTSTREDPFGVPVVRSTSASAVA